MIINNSFPVTLSLHFFPGGLFSDHVQQTMRKWDYTQFRNGTSADLLCSKMDHGMTGARRVEKRVSRHAGRLWLETLASSIPEL